MMLDGFLCRRIYVCIVHMPPRPYLCNTNLQLAEKGNQGLFFPQPRNAPHCTAYGRVERTSFSQSLRLWELLADQTLIVSIPSHH